MARYLGNSNTKEVHDLFNPKGNCQTDEISKNHRVSFDSLDSAHKAGYDNCYWCIGNSQH